jgi:2-phosphoglycerate kinase
MESKLIKLAEALTEVDFSAADTVYKLAGKRRKSNHKRHEKNKIKYPIKSQPAYKYIMYFKLMRGVDDDIFHRMKRQYLDTHDSLQKECLEEFNKLVLEDALAQKIPSSTIRKNFSRALADFETKYWNDYFILGSEKRQD